MDTAAPSPSGLWVDSKGNDVFSVTQAPYFIFQIMLVIYIVGFLGHLVLIQNATVAHTYNYQNNPGTLYTERENSSWWFALCFSCLRIFLFITVCSLITYRKTQCCCGKRGNRGCSVFWIFMLGICLTFDVIVVTLLGSFFSGCNVPGNANNPCNDLRYCHVPEVYNNLDSGCTYQTSWMPAISLAQLSNNVDFLWLFATSVVFLAFDLVFLLLPVSFWLGNSNPKIKLSDQDIQENIPKFDVLETPEIILEQEVAKKREFRKTKQEKVRRRPKREPVVIEEYEDESSESANIFSETPN